MTVSTETVRMAKSRPRKKQSERSDLPCHIINYITKRKKQKRKEKKNSLGSTYQRITIYTFHKTNLQYAT